MSPAFLDQMSWAMAEVYGSVTDRLLTNIARHFKYAQGPEDLMGSFQYQVRKLAELGQVNRESVDIIVSSLDGADGALRMSLELAIRDALKTVDPALRKAAERGLLQGAGTTPPEISPSQMQAFKAYYAQSADKLNLVNTVMLESTEDAYRACLSDVANRIQRSQSILNAGAGEVVTGVSSWNRAMHDAVDKMVQNGLTGFIDHAGRHWSPEAYVAMDIRTTMFNTARAAVWERAEEYGSDIYQVSTHNGARPKCYPWQGKLISRIDNSRDVPDLDGNMAHVYAQSETSYGAADGLFGVNCKHYPTPFIPGFSALRGEPQSPEENAKTYEESQQQRALERKVRDQKLNLSVMQAQGADEEDIQKQKAKVRAASADVQAFCDETGRTRRKSREYTPVNATWPDDLDTTPKKRGNVANVIDDYMFKATPGVGQYVVEPGYERNGSHADEKAIAQFLYQTYGGDITLRTEKNVYNVGDPDYEWRGKLWELKTPESNSKVNKRVQKALRQIAANPGGVIVDITKLTLSEADAWQQIESRMAISNKASTDIMLIRKGAVLGIRRFGK